MTAGPKFHRFSVTAGRLGRSARVLVAGALLVLGLSGVLAGSAGGPASAASACTSGGFYDNFATESALSSCWQTQTPLISAVAAKIGAVENPPQVSVSAGSLSFSGADGPGQFTAIQSAAAYSAPFTFSVNVYGAFSYGSAFGVYLTNANLSEAASVEGNVNPDAGADYGIFANAGLTADGVGQSLQATPGIGVNYSITISVDAAGDATATVNRSFAPYSPTPDNLGQVGKGPFYLLLGQDEGTPDATVLNEQATTMADPDNLAFWSLAELNDCPTASLSDDFTADGALSSCWLTSAAAGSASAEVASAYGDTTQVPSLEFGQTFSHSFGEYMDLQGAASAYQFAAVQSANAYQAPFQFNTSVLNIQQIMGDTPWAIWLVNSADPADTLTVQDDVNSALPDYGLYASTQLGPPTASSTLLSANPPLDQVYNVAMTIDSAGDASVSLSASAAYQGPATSLGQFSVGHVGLGSYYVVIGQQQGNETMSSQQETGWYTADLSPDYCSATSGTFYDDLATDTGLNSGCWSTSGAQLSAVASQLGVSSETPQLDFDNGLDMASGGEAGPVFSGLQSLSPYSAPFDFETTVNGVASSANAFSVYLVGTTGTSALSVEGNLGPSNTPYYGLWDNQAGIPAGYNSPGSEDLIASPTEGTNYAISISVDSAGVASVEVNGTTSTAHATVGTGPFYVVLGQGNTDGSANDGPNQATWSTASLTSPVHSSLSTVAPTVAGVESVPASAVPVPSASGAPSTVSGDPASAPLSSIPLASSPLSSIPLSSIPLSSIAVPASGDTAVAAAQQALSTMLLSDIAITYPAGCGASPAAPCTGWAGILAGTPYAGSPLEGVTLEDVLTNPAALANFNSVDLGALNLAASPLSSIPLSSIPLSSIPLSSIPLPGAASGAAGALTAWCNQLGDLGFACSSFGINTVASPANANGVTLLTLALAGVPLSSIPLSSIPLSSIPLSSINLGASPLSSIPLSSISLASNPLSSIPLSSILLGSVPLSSIPLSSIPLSSIPLSSIPLSSIPLSSIPLSSIPLSSIPLSSIPLSSIPLGSLPLSSIPLSSIPLSSIPLSSIPLSSIPLSSIPLSSIALAGSPLSSIPLSSIGDLSEVVNCAAFTCGAATLGQAQAAQDIFPSATLGEVGTYSTETLGQLAASDGGTYNGTTLGQLGTYAGTTLGEIGTADGGNYNGTTLGQLGNADGGNYNGTTLGQLGAYGATTLGQLGTYNGMTLAQLLSDVNTSGPGFPAITLGDLLLSTVPPGTYSWQSVDLADLPLAADETGGGTTTYTATVSVASPGAQQVSVTLPPSFSYVPGTTTLDGATEPDPTGGPSLTWTLPMSEGAHTLQFKANAGIGLGPAPTAISVNAQPTSTASASVEVIDGEAPAINSAATAVPLAAGTPPYANGDLNVGYITSPGDLNDWSVQVAQGEELSLSLTNLPATYDLELFGPSAQQLQGTPSQDLSGVTDTLPTLSPTTATEATSGSQDLPVTPPAGDSLQAISNNPDSQDQYIQTTPLAAGTYIVQVSGYNGAYSSQPYLLQANLLTGATTPSCPSITYPNAMPSPASGPVSVPVGVNTLFLVDTQRLSAAFGPAAEAAIMSDLQAVASDSAAGVNGTIVPVDSYANVQAAYANWDANPCSVNGANGVVAAISTAVDQIEADNASVQNLVIIGADDQIPFARLADGASQSNERDYGLSTFAGENNVEADALALGYYFSDDPYASPQPLGVGSATLYTPQLAVGRLVESPTEIESALTRFVSSNGDLNAKAGLTTGYSFLTSGADAVSADLAADGLTPETLINASWTEGQLDAALVASPTPGVDSLNAHFDYSRAEPASDDASGVDTNLVTTTDIRNSLSSFAGRLLFSMGCHSGLDIDDAEISASGVSTPVDDWAKTFADAGALWVGNTGYGYADTDTLAYSAKLMAEFAGDLNGSLTIGEALTQAKQQYAAGNAVLSPYDLKALMESTFYGLPMYNLNKPGTPVPPPTGPPTAVVNPATGLTNLASPIAVSLTQGTGPGQFGLVSTANGNYYQVNGTTGYNPGTQTTEFRPIEPLVTEAVTEPGLVPHGALITALSSADLADPTPAYSLPTAGSADATPPEIGQAAFPGALQRVATFGTFTSTGTGQGAQLDLVAGQFLPNPSAPGTGTERLFSSISAQVYYLPVTSPYAGDFTPPTIGSTTANPSGNVFDFNVQVAPSTAAVQQVLVLYTDAAHPGTWTTANLSLAGGQTWTGTGALTPSGQVQYMVEALDAAGNVAVSNNEGTAFNASSPPAVSLTLSGSGPTNGFYTGAVTVDITAPTGSTYVLDGAGPTAVPSGGTLTVTNSGEHTITVNAPEAGATATQSFAISMYQTGTTLSSAANSAVIGQSVNLTAAVNAASSGVGNPTGAVEFFDGTTPIAACGGAAGTALANNGTAVCPVSYGAAGAHQFVASYLANGNFAGSTSAPLGLAVNPRSALLSAFKVAPSAATYGAEKSVVFSATVLAGDPDAFPTGDTVVVAQGPNTICALTLVPGTGAASNSGSGSCSPSSNTLLAAGSYSVTATFADNGASPSFSAVAPVAISLVVNKATPTITWLPPAAITFGTALSSTQLDATASVAGTLSYDPAARAVLQPGTQTLEVSFTPANTTDYNPATATTAISVGPTQACITTNYSGSLSVAKGQVMCLGTGGKITGSVSVASGAAFYTSGGSIGGSLSSSGALALTLCGTTVTGSVSVASTTGPVTLGGPGCSGDTIGGSLSLSANTGGLSLQSAHITGSLSVAANSAGVVISANTITGSASVVSNSGGCTFTNNTISGSLAIVDNTGGFTYSGNTVHGSVSNSGNS